MKTDITFKSLGVSVETLSVLEKKGFTNASEIQAKILPLVLQTEEKHDIIGISQTGSGKTGAFGIGILDKIKIGNKTPKVIILTPTRELAIQVTEELKSFTSKRLKIRTVYGGTPLQGQIREVKQGVDIVVGTPGRVLDLLSRKALILSQIEYFVLDEADEMLKMGFIEPIEEIMSKMPKEKQVFLFSATMPPKIKALSKKYMKNQIIIEVKKKFESKANITQLFYPATRFQKMDILSNIIDSSDFFYGVVFCMTKKDVEEVTQNLKNNGYSANCIHGDIQQSKREKVLKSFKDQKITILVATDVAARGIDVQDLTHVINYTLPKENENYVHRIGRTGRAGKKGTAISFVAPRQQFVLRELERLTKGTIEKYIMPNQHEIAEKKIQNQKDEFKKIITEFKSSKANEDLKNELLNEFDTDLIINALISKISKKATTKKYENFDDNESYQNNNGKRNDRRDRRGGNDRDRNSKGKFDKKIGGKSIRLFIAKGTNQGITNRELFSLLEKKSRISIDGEDIKISDKFSFVTVPEEQANKIIQSFKGDGDRRPLVTKAEKSRR
jgi:ATP-dependent RNA helicase DeaD